ncbi:hypothetical protein [Novosphingopyxis sp. YJ-S2-01]|uniref:hypothetical protein n=1 Tax=Novosphingopyxis sp. YJ-S2-01 TaxID=2794021 RepID=UPI0018DBAAE7|nr:hypothetical protein [Novosphingopyxis sp. YJ-S2-01]MBH9537535.1 hypothetical protein [Novosphingopyxis sp. YJ-S2-01]
MSEFLPTNRRIFGIIQEGAAGQTILRLTAREPSAPEDAMAVLLLRGQIPEGLEKDVPIFSDPSLNPDLRGLPGDEGPNGWTPKLRAVSDGTRTLMEVAGWVQSSGKPATGFLTSTGELATDKAQAFNFNAVKRVRAFSAQTNSSGIATIPFTMAGEPGFAQTPQVIVLAPNPNIAIGRYEWSEVAGSRTKDSVQVLVRGSALTSGLLGPLAGATANVIAIEL